MVVASVVLEEIDMEGPADPADCAVGPSEVAAAAYRSPSLRWPPCLENPGGLRSPSPPPEPVVGSANLAYRTVKVRYMIA